jgi:phage tail tape-measure protein
MGVEQAIVALQVQGGAEVSAEADRIVVKLDALERAAKRAEDAAQAAENAAKDAEAAARALSTEITKTFSQLAHLAHTAKHIAHELGVGRDSKLGGAIEILGGGLSGAVQGARLGSIFGPLGTAIGAAGGGLLGEYAAHEAVEKRILEHNRRIEEQERRRLAKDRDERLVEELLRQVGLVKLDNHHFGPRQVP